MRIIISPAKKMKINPDPLEYQCLPYFIEDSKILLAFLKNLHYDKVKSIWNCNDKIATLNYDRIQQMDLHCNLTTAILAYEGIQYQYMAPEVFETEEIAYIEEHLRILSGFYGMLRPLDGVVPYRLEMQAKLEGKYINSLYNFWNRRLADQLFTESDCIINLASKEYSRCISNYLHKDVQFITCIFGEWKENKVIEKGTQVKMARGEMVRYMAENKVMNVEELKSFQRLNYRYEEQLSDQYTLTFLRK